VQSARGRPNLPAISASGRVTAARGFAAPESGSTFTVLCTDDDTDIRSVDLDGAVQPSDHLFVTLLLQIDSFFVSLWNRAIFWPSVSPCGTLQNVVL